MKHLVILFMLFSSSYLNASCARTYSLTEILTQGQEHFHIFVCKIDSTYFDNYNTRHTAEVIQTFNGNPEAEIILSSGKSLYEGMHYLIVSQPYKKNQYGAFGCEGNSTLIKHSDNVFKLSDKKYYAMNQDHLEIVKQYYQYVNNRYTGEVVFKNKNNIVAEGSFHLGKPHGVWKHYYSGRSNDIRSKISFSHGKLSGLFEYYNPSKKSASQKPHPYSKEYYRNDTLYYSENFRLDKVVSTQKMSFINKNKVQVESINFSLFGDTIEISNRASYYRRGYFYRSKAPRGQFRFNYNHGFFLKDHSKARKKKNLIEKGYYFRNKKVGVWESFDSLMVPIKKETFPFPDTTGSNFKIFHLKEDVHISGEIVDGLPIGEWKQFRDGKECGYSTFKNGKPHGEEKWTFDNGTSTISNYENGMLNGPKFRYNKDDTISSQTNYLARRRNGKELTYYKNGSTSIIYNFRNGSRHGSHRHFFPDGSYKISTNYFQDKLHGVYYEYHSDGSIKTFGSYLHGHKNGIWKESLKNENGYTITKFEIVKHKPNYRLKINPAHLYDSNRVFRKVFIEGKEKPKHPLTYPRIKM